MSCQMNGSAPGAGVLQTDRIPSRLRTATPTAETSTHRTNPSSARRHPKLPLNLTTATAPWVVVTATDSGSVRHRRAWGVSSAAIGIGTATGRGSASSTAISPPSQPAQDHHGRVHQRQKCTSSMKRSVGSHARFISNQPASIGKRR